MCGGEEVQERAGKAEFSLENPPLTGQQPSPTQGKAPGLSIDRFISFKMKKELLGVHACGDQDNFVESVFSFHLCMASSN